MDFSLFYFSNDDGGPAGNRYELLLEGARFADDNGFTAVWTPERHFHQFGGIYPNPSVTGAAIAAITRNVGVRAGSVVAPLHHPLRLAEEWSVVDNLSGGRAGISLASGWHATDFCFNPQAYATRQAVMFDYVEKLRALWRGESLEVVDGKGATVRVQVHPRPVQEQIPIWITSAGNPDTFRNAGRVGAGLLTHLLGQDIDQLAQRIAEYRAAAAESGHRGHVAVMVHTFVGADDAAIRELVREPMSRYLRSSLGLLLGSQPDAKHRVDPATLSEKNIDFLVTRAFDRYFDDGGLLGAVDKAQRVVARLAAIGVDEIACLIDFGLPAPRVLAALKDLVQLLEAGR